MTFALRPAVEADFEPLLDLSIRVLRADLERVLRFDPERRRVRMRAVFGSLSVIEAEGVRAGCIGVVPQADHVEVHSFYLEPALQGRGRGRAVLVAALAPHAGLPVRIEVLRGAPVYRFWEAQGFLRTGAQDYDWLYERPATS